MPLFHSPLSGALALITAWALIGLMGLLRPSGVRFITRVLFPLGAATGVALALAAAAGLSSRPESLTLLIGLPDLPFHVRLDPLASVFLFLLGSVSAGISIFAAGYFRHDHGGSPGLLCVQYHLFLASMGLVFLANDAYAFMVAWETMALASYFLVTTQHGDPEIRRAGFLYLIVAHVGAIAILLSFGVLQGGSWLFTFDAMREAHLSPQWAAIAFVLALVGFGAKAGLVPLHVWLPEAHPAAPSPVSALMSGVMLKTAVYGILRITFDLLGTANWWWGLLPLGIGLFTALFGVVFAAAQTDMKRLLAYSSVENIGIIFTALGLAIVFAGVGMPSLSALALIALLYHSLNHAFMKSLLFAGTGAVLHTTGERSLGRLGGLIRRMPWVAWLTLVGALALALAAALAAYVMVKFYGVVFLGQPRDEALSRAHDAGFFERVGLVWLALGCVALGLFPTHVVNVLGTVVASLTGAVLDHGSSPWWLLAPVPGRHASYSAVLFLVAIATVVALTIAAVSLFYHRRVNRVPPWDCGFGLLNPRMQDTAEGFGQPIRHIFGSFFAMRRELPSPFDTAPRYRVTIEDRFWRALYVPLGSLVERAANAIAWLQQGRIATYLLYSFVTLVALLALVL